MENESGLELRDCKNRANHLLWEDLIVVTNNLTRKNLLNGVSGFAESNRIMAIMGPSGSGKSTLLDSLAGRLSSNLTMTGNVMLHGRKNSINTKDVSYATQQDFLFGTLTVRETLTYSAHLRLPSSKSKEEINQVIEDTITKMGLQDCVDSKIGNWHFRGISGGEKRRLSIGLEILTQPDVLFLDEPTSGLDSAASFFVIQVLRNIAYDGKIVVCSIHQPGFDVFNLFDDLFILSGGETVYFGEAKMAVKFFDDAGLPCPMKTNPPDHFLRCITQDFDNIFATLKQHRRNLDLPESSSSRMRLTAAEIKAELITKYKSSSCAEKARKRIQELLTEEHFSSRLVPTDHPNQWRQLQTLIRRSTLNMSRDLGYFWIRILFYIGVAVSTGTLYFDIGTNNKAITARGKCDGFLYGQMVCLSVGAFPFLVEELKVFNRERLGGYYGETVYIMANFISSFPFIVAISVSSATVLYFLVKFHMGFSHFLYFCINLLCCISVSEAVVLVVSSLVSNPMMGMGITAGITILHMMPSPITRNLSDIPKIFWIYPMSYISYVSWGVQGHFKNDMIGLEFDPTDPGQPKVTGEIVLRTYYGINPDRSKWWDLAALLCIAVAYRIIFCITLKCRELLFCTTLNCRERASSLFHGVPVKKVPRSGAHRVSLQQE